MNRKKAFKKTIVAASISLLGSGLLTLADERSGGMLDTLYDALRHAEAEAAVAIERDIIRLWELSGSDSIDFLYKKADEAFEAKDFKSAVDHFSAVVEFAPDFAMGWYGRSRAYANLGYNGPALADLEQVLALDPQNFFAILGLGQLFQSLGRPDLALKAYDQALEVHPHFAVALELKDALAAHVQDKNI